VHQLPPRLSLAARALTRSMPLLTTASTRQPVPGQSHWRPGIAWSGHHGHLWSLPDGTGLHAPAGILVTDAAGRLCCHLCGRWFTALGVHVGVHGHTARTYREAIGLPAGRVLATAEVSESIRAGKARGRAARLAGSPAAASGEAPLTGNGADLLTGIARLEGWTLIARRSVPRPGLAS